MKRASHVHVILDASHNAHAASQTGDRCLVFFCYTPREMSDSQDLSNTTARIVTVVAAATFIVTVVLTARFWRRARFQPSTTTEISTISPRRSTRPDSVAAS